MQFELPLQASLDQSDPYVLLVSVAKLRHQAPAAVAALPPLDLSPKMNLHDFISFLNNGIPFIGTSFFGFSRLSDALLHI
ncbi:hypothetical protein SLE2022_384250 [Rubroshorea leprosula]